MRCVRVTALLLLIVVGWCMSPAEAKVFRRWGGATHSLEALAAAGGRVAYTAPVDVNGVSGELHVVAFEQGYRQLIRELARSIPGLRRARKTAVATAAWEAGGRQLHVIAIAAQGQSIVFHLSHTPTADASPAWPAVVPAYPGAAARFVARNGDTGSLLAVAHGRMPVSAVREFYQRELIAAGWQPMFDAAPDTPALALFVKAEGVCGVFAHRDPEGDTQILVVHKPLGGLR